MAHIGLRDGHLVVTTDGEVISGKNVNGCIVVKAVGVTVENSKAQCVAMEDRARDPANPRLTVQDVEIDCRNGGGAAGTPVSATATSTSTG